MIRPSSGATVCDKRVETGYTGGRWIGCRTLRSESSHSIERVFVALTISWSVSYLLGSSNFTSGTSNRAPSLPRFIALNQIIMYHKQKVNLITETWLPLMSPEMGVWNGIICEMAKMGVLNVMANNKTRAFWPGVWPREWLLRSASDISSVNQRWTV